jgi:hypothetical protein
LEIDMSIESKVAAHFGSSDLFFDESSYFAFSLSCTVRVGGVWFDVWFDADHNITCSAEAQ